MKLESKNRNQIYKKIIFNHLGNQCFFCKTDQRLGIHHRDNDFNNNYFSNLLLLCRKCHSQRHGLEIKIYLRISSRNFKKEEIPELLEAITKLYVFLSKKRYDILFSDIYTKEEEGVKIKT